MSSLSSDFSDASAPLMSRRPKHALVLAAGFGTRLSPLSASQSKCLFPVWNVPLLELAIRRLETWGVTNILVNTHHAAPEIFDWIRHQKFASQVDISFEPQILGTGGAIRRAAWFFSSGPTWIVNADILFSLEPTPLVRGLSAPQTIASAWVTNRAGPRTVEVGDGCVTDFASPHPHTAGTWTFCGLQLVTPDLLRYVPKQPFSSIIEAYRRAMQAGHHIRAVDVPDALWADTGTPEGLLEAHRLVQRSERRFPSCRPGLKHNRRRIRELRARGVTISGTAAIGEEANIASGAVLHDCLLWGPCHLTGTANVKNALLAGPLRLGGSTTRFAVSPEQFGPGHPLQHVLTRLKWRPKATAVEILSPRGSARTFYRIKRGLQSHIVICYALDRPENAHFASLAHFLNRHGIPVPRVIADYPALKTTVCDDSGRLDLQRAFAQLGARDRMHVYARILDITARLHDCAPAARRKDLPLQPPFSDALYAWEHRLFDRYFLSAHLELSARDRKRILRSLQRISASFNDDKQVLVHRDLQSSNIILGKCGPVLIDFQGMRYGHPAYDVASLLCDPYVSLSWRCRHRLLSHYVSRSDVHSDAFTEAFYRMTCQRLTQAIGAFVRLSGIPGMAHYRDYIHPALLCITEALANLDNYCDLKAHMAFCLQMEEQASA